ncbi:helix-turn-helix domain-containing protein [Sulfoacidibacillus thermotolerans]|nr:helix-turn-helix transcriptional regulator [Sulfoacidibacillus thermotolerans]
MTHKEVGRLLREIRHSAGVSQEDVAFFAGVQQPHISRIEYGINAATLPILVGYAKATRNHKKILELIEREIGGKTHECSHKKFAGVGA